MFLLGKLDPPLWHQTDTCVSSNDLATKLEAKNICIDPSHIWLAYHGLQTEE